MSQTAIIAIIIISIELGILVGILFYLFYRIKNIIGENVLKNSVYTLLEHNYWKDKRSIKDANARTEIAIAESLRANKSEDNAYKEIEKLLKVIQNGK